MPSRTAALVALERLSRPQLLSSELFSVGASAGLALMFPAERSPAAQGARDGG